MLHKLLKPQNFPYHYFNIYIYLIEFKLYHIFKSSIKLLTRHIF